MELNNLTSVNESIDAAESMPCQRTVFLFVIYGPVWGTVTLFGLVGNTLSFFVLQRYGKNNIANYQLKALAVTDNLFLIFSSVQMFQAMMVSFGLEELLVPIFPYLQTYVWPLSHISQMFTIWMTFLIATNRYIAVCKPLHAPSLCTKRKVKIQIISMVICVIIYNVPRFFEYRYESINTTDPLTNTSRVEQQQTGLVKYRLYNILYENIAYCLFFFAIPLVTLIALNSCLIRKLNKAKAFRDTSTSRNSSDENNVTLIMVVIICVFIICNTPSTLNQFLYYIVSPNEKSKCSYYTVFFHISNLLLITSSCMNFVIYCLLRKQFQQDLSDMLLCRKERRRSHNSTVIKFNSSLSKAAINKSSIKSTTMECTPLTFNDTQELTDDSTCITSRRDVNNTGRTSQNKISQSDRKEMQSCNGQIFPNKLTL